MSKFYKKHKANRSEYTDSEIMDALDASFGNINDAAKRMGLHCNTLRAWIRNSPSLSTYVQLLTESRAEEIETVFMDIVRASRNDPAMTGYAISAGKILLDKIKANKLDVNHSGTITNEISDDAKARLKELLGD
jgi:hypothetical protein